MQFPLAWFPLTLIFGQFIQMWENSMLIVTILSQILRDIGTKMSWYICPFIIHKFQGSQKNIQ